jgi:hypothetical protein
MDYRQESARKLLVFRLSGLDCAFPPLTEVIEGRLADPGLRNCPAYARVRAEGEMSAEDIETFTSICVHSRLMSYGRSANPRLRTQKNSWPATAEPCSLAILLSSSGDPPASRL